MTRQEAAKQAEQAVIRENKNLLPKFRAVGFKKLVIKCGCHRSGNHDPAPFVQFILTDEKEETRFRELFGKQIIEALNLGELAVIDITNIKNDDDD